jgi:hypothetical protein
MAYNKIQYGDETLIDLTGDTVTPETLVQGRTATAANGEKIVGLMPTITEQDFQEVAELAQNASTKVDDLEARMDSGEFKFEWDPRLMVYTHDDSGLFIGVSSEVKTYDIILKSNTRYEFFFLVKEDQVELYNDMESDASFISSLIKITKK